MSTKALDAGKAFIDGILAKLPENLRDAAKTALLAPEATDALTFAGEGALARADYSRQMDAIRQKEEAITTDYERLNAWYTTKQEDLAELDQYRTGKKTPAGAPPERTTQPTAPDLSGVVKVEDFTRTMQEQQLSAANYLALQNTLTMQHYDRFKEVIDARELLKDPSLGKQKSDGATYGLIDAYQTKYAEKLAAYTAEQETKRVNQLVEAQVAERLKSLPQAQAFPLRSQPSALDLLDTPEFKPEQFTAQAAADEYARLQQQRTS